MRLDGLIERCQQLEDRVATLYRAYAASARSEPDLCSLWTALAREEEEHSRTLAAARLFRAQVEAARTDVEGCEAALQEVAQRLTAAEQLATGASLDRQLAAALELEMTELEPLRRLVLAASHRPDRTGHQTAHVDRLARAARRYSSDPHVVLLAAVLRARTRLREEAA